METAASVVPYLFRLRLCLRTTVWFDVESDVLSSSTSELESIEGTFFFLGIAGRKSPKTERGLATGEKVGGGSKEEKRVESASDSNHLIM